MIASERYEKIVEMVDANGIKNIKDLAEALNVTEMTIRRDCEVLEQEGKLIRVRGGAKSIKRTEIVSTQDEKRMIDREENYLQKDAICKKAASFVKEGDCIYLDVGTTIVPMLKYLRGKKVKIVTCSLLIANAFIEDPDTELFFIGGKYMPRHSMFVDLSTLEILKRFNFDHAFIGCLGIDIQRNVTYNTDMESAVLKKTAMDLSIKNYLLIDSSKLAVKGFYSSLSYEEFDVVICDDNLNIAPEDIPDNFILVNVNDEQA